MLMVLVWIHCVNSTKMHIITVFMVVGLKVQAVFFFSYGGKLSVVCLIKFDVLRCRCVVFTFK